MSQHGVHSTITSFSGIDGDVQVAVGPKTGTIIFDAQGAAAGVDGIVRHNHGTVRLSYASARELRDFLDHLDEPADPRQPALPAIWSEPTYTGPVRTPARRLRRRIAA